MITTVVLVFLLIYAGSVMKIRVRDETSDALFKFKRGKQSFGLCW